MCIRSDTATPIEAFNTETRMSSPYNNMEQEPPRKKNSSATKREIQHNYHDHANDDGKVYMETPLVSKGGVTVPFPMKLHNMLEHIAQSESELEHIVSWQPHGRCFLVHKIKEFQEGVLPRFFQQKKYASFQRQLNLYGFSRLTKGPDRGAYYHELFLRSKQILCRGIYRMKVKGTGSRMASNPDQEPNFYLMAPMPSSTPPSLNHAYIEPSNADLEPTPINSIEPTSLDIEPTCLSSEPNAIKIEPTSLNIEPNAIKIEPNAIKTEPFSLRQESISNQLQSNNMNSSKPLEIYSSSSSTKNNYNSYFNPAPPMHTSAPSSFHPTNSSSENNGPHGPHGPHGPQPQQPTDDTNIVFDNMQFHEVGEGPRRHSLMMMGASSRRLSTQFGGKRGSITNNANIETPSTSSFVDDQFDQEMELISQLADRRLSDDQMGDILDKIIDHRII